MERVGSSHPGGEPSKAGETRHGGQAAGATGSLLEW